MKQKKVSYKMPESMATKTGNFSVVLRYNDTVKQGVNKGKLKSKKVFETPVMRFVELIKEPCADSELETDIDFPFIMNGTIPVFKGRKEHEINFNLNLN
jgi:hypothetical protein